MEKKKTFIYGSMLLVECFFWGVGNPVMKIGLTVIPPLFCLSIRYILAVLLFLPFLGKRVFAHVTLKQLPIYMLIAAFTAGSFITSAFSLMHTTATNSGFLMSTAVIFTPFLSYFILKSKLDKKHIIPILIVIVGLFLLCSGGGAFSFGLGEFLAVLCSISGAGMLVFSSKYLQDMDPLVTTVMQTLFTGLFCLIFSLAFEDRPSLSEIPMLGWGVIVYLAVGCTCIAYVFQNLALRHVPATYAALAFCSEPIFTAIASYFMLGEQLSAKGLIGAGLIMISIIIGSLLPEELPESIQHPDTPDSIDQPEALHAKVGQVQVLPPQQP
ncbi:DMT family transporter [Aminipila butyrica]|uniref:DMT family transporter n=1 Tax=Aminipila butyrica TaxID=433296 RepID=A0A858BV38_9FIRM|nr:DMT family transporter [Aminipila butyrica]QIB68968.1 DMT family transporter [Aminipila butyrica]